MENPEKKLDENALRSGTMVESLKEVIEALVNEINLVLGLSGNRQELKGENPIEMGERYLHRLSRIGRLHIASWSRDNISMVPLQELHRAPLTNAVTCAKSMKKLDRRNLFVAFLNMNEDLIVELTSVFFFVVIEQQFWR
jgi:hypothetical protein